LNSHRIFGHSIQPQHLPLSLENVWTELSDEETHVTFVLSNGNILKLVFDPEQGIILIPEANGGTPSVPVKQKVSEVSNLRDRVASTLPDGSRNDLLAA
jgi:hypothetical protein